MNQQQAAGDKEEFVSELLIGVTHLFFKEE